MRSYLIQRGKFRNTKIEEIVGIDSLISFDYMGSAEFEFGALPQSLKRIVANLSNYAWKKEEGIKSTDGKEMFIYFDNNHEKDVELCAVELANEQYGRRKEYCDMFDYIRGEKTRNDFWWDIENDFMVCFGVENKRKITIAIEKLKEKWANK